jgi:hypothetical protein
MTPKTTDHLLASHLATGLASAPHPGQPGPALGRVVLLAVAVLAVGAFTFLQVRARSRQQRPPGPDRARSRAHGPAGRGRYAGRRGAPRRGGAPDWRTPPSRYGRDVPAGEAPGSEAPDGNQERYRPDWRYGYPPGYEPSRRERGPAS